MVYLMMKSKGKGRKKIPIVRHYLQIAPEKKIHIEYKLKSWPKTKKEKEAVIKAYTPRIMKDVLNLKSRYNIKRFKTQLLTNNELLALEKIRYIFNHFFRKYYHEEFLNYLDHFTIHFIHSSISIEGSSLELKDVALLLRDGISPTGKKLREIHEATNAKDALDYAEKHISKGGKLTQQFIKKTNELILENIRTDGGTYRGGPMFITGSTVQTTPPIFIEEEIQKLLKWNDENEKELHPIELAGVFYHRFEVIHPFGDGNGRVGRQLMNCILIKNKYPPICIHHEHREEYITALVKADDGDYGPLLKFLVRTIISQYAIICASIVGISEDDFNEYLGIEVADKYKYSSLEEFGLTTPFRGLGVKSPQKTKGKEARQLTLIDMEE